MSSENRINILSIKRQSGAEEEEAEFQFAIFNATDRQYDKSKYSIVFQPSPTHLNLLLKRNKVTTIKYLGNGDNKVVSVGERNKVTTPPSPPVPSLTFSLSLLAIKNLCKCIRL